MNTLYYAEREFNGRVHRAERASQRELLFQSLPIPPLSQRVAGLARQVATGPRRVAGLFQAVMGVVRSSLESRTPQEQCC
jgi:hypothetical protein